MDKAKSMQHQACIPDSWWEFAFAHTTHIYNHTLVAHLQWCTPHEMLTVFFRQVDPWENISKKHASPEFKENYTV